MSVPVIVGCGEEAFMPAYVPEREELRKPRNRVI